MPSIFILFRKSSFSRVSK